MKYEQKKERLQRLSEAQFRGNVLLPLLKAMGFTAVRVHHSSIEYGKDLLFRSTTQWGDADVYAVVVTMHDITGNASDPNNAQRVLQQVKMALNQPYDDVYTGRQTKVDRCWVMCGGTIKPTAPATISGELDNSYLNRLVTYFDIDRIIELLNRFYPEYWKKDPNWVVPVEIKLINISVDLVPPYDKGDDDLSAAGSLERSVAKIKRLVYNFLMEIDDELLKPFHTILQSNNPMDIVAQLELIETAHVNGYGELRFGTTEWNAIQHSATSLMDDLREYESRHGGDSRD